MRRDTRGDITDTHHDASCSLDRLMNGGCLCLCGGVMKSDPSKNEAAAGAATIRKGANRTAVIAPHSASYRGPTGAAANRGGCAQQKMPSSVVRFFHERITRGRQNQCEKSRSAPSAARPHNNHGRGERPQRTTMVDKGGRLVCFATATAPTHPPPPAPFRTGAVRRNSSAISRRAFFLDAAPRDQIGISPPVNGATLQSGKFAGKRVRLIGKVLAQVRTTTGHPAADRPWRDLRCPTGPRGGGDAVAERGARCCGRARTVMGRTLLCARH